MSEAELSTTLPSETQQSLLPQELPEDNSPAAIKALAGLSVARQLGLMFGLALSVAIGVAVVLWSQTSSYSLLFASIAEHDAAEILDVLDKLGTDYKVEEGSGAIMVAAGDVRKIKLKLAAQGLPRSDSLGYELLDKETGFGTSKSSEMLRFKRALEGEIARTITSIQSIKTAKVLLALPKQSVFVRERKNPSASVIVKLYQGRRLEKDQIQSIVHLVASSVPLLEAEQVTVVDQQGRLLNAKDSSAEMFMNSKHFEYKKQLEEHLMGRIENILKPLLGNGMRVQLSADVDFTVTEKTQEIFNPDLPALRSEQTSEEQNILSAVQGVPGALSNQPPPAGVAPEVAGAGAENAANAATPKSATKTATRNFELDKTITHTRQASGLLRRLSVAVVVDHQHIPQVDGSSLSQPYSKEDINRFTELVKQAVGFDMHRGDQVTVSNIAFLAPEEIEALPEKPLWEQSWFIDLMKQLAGVIIVLLLIFAVLRPAMRALVGRVESEKKALKQTVDEKGNPVRYDEKGVPIALPDNDTAPNYADMETEDLLLLEAPQSYEKRLEFVKKLVDEDAKLVAQVIKTWVEPNG